MSYLSLSIAIAVIAIVVSVIEPARGQSACQVVRDRWGIAHVFAEDERALFYGAGYAMAEDRLVQMMLLRHEAEGRLSEILGPGEKDRFIQSDKTYRVLSFDRHARRILHLLRDDTLQNLNAFAAGVNAYAIEHPGRLTSLVEVFAEQRPRPWEAADSITVWSRYAYQFTSGWENEIPALKQYEQWSKSNHGGALFPGARFLRDDSAAIVTEEEFRRSNPPEVYHRLKQAAAVPAPTLSWVDGHLIELKASHNWVVSGARSSTGKPILESNPQLPVSFPATMYEMHLCGGRYDVRGVSFPGTPAIFIGWNRRCAWGATALGGDHADLFEERVDPQDANAYLFGNQSRPFSKRMETIRIKGRDPIHLEIRETLHGPIVNSLLDDLSVKQLYSLRHIILANEYSSLESQLEMMRAQDWPTFSTAMRQFVAPALNMIFADDAGNIGYRAAVLTPKRRGLEPLPRRGWTEDDEWQMIPFEDMPAQLNPVSETIFTANHLPIGSWYPYIVSTSRGDGPRSWRLRELLAGSRKFTVEDFHQTIHLDSVNPGVRDFVKLATKAVREQGVSDLELDRSLTTLETWNGEMLTSSPAFPLARSVLEVLLEQTTSNSTAFENFGPEWDQYVGSWSGINQLIKNLSSHGQPNHAAPVDNQGKKWLRESLLQAIEQARVGNRFTPPVVHRMPYQNNLGQWGSLQPAHDLISPPLACPVTQTIWSQTGETYVQIVDLANIDQSLSLLPPGNSEDPTNRHAVDQIPLWGAGQLHPAPLSRVAVERVAESTRQLTYSP